MKRTIANGVGWFFVLLTGLTGLAWYNNIRVALQWNPNDGHGGTYLGPVSWLDWSAVDFSTASTFIPFFGVLLIAAGFFRISKAKENSDVLEHFPFFGSYIPITIALGLIGTVWGLIMIGYYDPKKVQMAQLILCLRTALYSTLVALVWVFLFVLPVRYIMQRVHRYVSNYRDPGDAENILSILKNLGSAALGTTEGLRKADNGFSELNARVAGAKTEFKEVAKVLTTIKAKVDGMFNETKKVLGQMHLGFQSWQKAAEEHQKLLQDFKKQLDQEKQQKEEAEKRAKEAERTREETEAKLRRVKEVLT